MSKRAGRPSPDNPTSGVMRRAVTKGRFAVRPGTFNLAGQFFTPDGGRLEKVVADVDVTQVRALSAFVFLVVLSPRLDRAYPLSRAGTDEVASS